MVKLFLVTACLMTIHLYGQSGNKLTYRDAVELALKNNYDILIARNNTGISRVENNYGNAGFLPTVDVTAGANRANNDTRQEFSNGSGVNRSGVVSSNLSAGAYLSWTVFDGMKMFATKERLGLLEQQGELSFKLQLEATIEEVTNLYFQVIRQEQWIKGIEAAMAVSDERIRLADKRINIGSGSRVELLQARMDLNAQKAEWMAQRNILNDTRSSLLTLIRADLPLNVPVDTVFEFENVQAMEIIREKIEQENVAIQFARKNLLVVDQYRKELRAEQLPSLALNSNYLYSRSENAAGLVLLNRNLGFNAGLALKWNLYHGSTLRSRQQIADIQYRSAGLAIENLRMNLQHNMQSAYRRWLAAMELLELEEGNRVLAEESLKITMERLKLGLGNYLEVRESQNSYEAATSRLVNARYALKQQETILKRLCGELVK